MKLVITIDPVGDVQETAKLVHQIADKLQQQVRQLQLHANIVSTYDHDEIVGTVEFIPHEPECNCNGGEQGEGLVSIPHEPHCPKVGS
jgi:hypothetical protein